MCKYTRVRRAIRDWLRSPDLNVFVSVTLKQALPSEHGTLSPLTPEALRKTAWLLRDRLTKALVGAASYKRGHRPAFLVFAEGGGSKRLHLHIVACRPAEVALEEYAALVHKVARRLDWVHVEIDVRAITPGTADRVLGYSLKEGADAFIPEASFAPSQQTDLLVIL